MITSRSLPYLVTVIVSLISKKDFTEILIPKNIWAVNGKIYRPKDRQQYVDTGWRNASANLRREIVFLYLLCKICI